MQSPARVNLPGTPTTEKIDIHVDPTLRKKIIEGKAIDLVDIFDNDPRKTQLNEVHEGESDKKKQKKMLTRHQWLEAFTIYSFILAKAKPQEAAGLFVHLNHVIEIQNERKDWHLFDITVRRLIAEGDRQWGDPCLEEKLTARSRPEIPIRGAQNSGDSRGTVHSSKSYEVPYGWCVDFHLFNRCEEGEKCRLGWLHKCYKCRAPTPHRAAGCTKNAPPSQRSGRQPFRRDRRK